MSRPAPVESPDVRRGRTGTWVALVVITVGVAFGFMLDTDAEPAAQGLVAALAAFQVMLALYWRRNRDRRR